MFDRLRSEAEFVPDDVMTLILLMKYHGRYLFMYWENGWDVSWEVDGRLIESHHGCLLDALQTVYRQR